MKRILVLVLQQLMPTGHHHRIDLLQRLLGKQTHVVNNGLQAILVLISKICMPQHLAQRRVKVRLFYQTVEVAVERLLQRAQHEDPPQTQARSTTPQIDLRAQVLPKDREHPLAGPAVREDVLQSTEYGRNIVSGPRVKADLSNGRVPKLKLCLEDRAHSSKTGECWGGSVLITPITGLRSDNDATFAKTTCNRTVGAIALNTAARGAIMPDFLPFSPVHPPHRTKTADLQRPSRIFRAITR